MLQSLAAEIVPEEVKGHTLPMHDWSRIPAGLFHDFQQTWSIQIKFGHQRRILPRGLTALVEQRSGPRESDALAIESLARPSSEFGHDGGVATEAAPVTRFVGRRGRRGPACVSRMKRATYTHAVGAGRSGDGAPSNSEAGSSPSGAPFHDIGGAAVIRGECRSRFGEGRTHVRGWWFPVRTTVSRPRSRRGDD